VADLRSSQERLIQFVRELEELPVWRRRSYLAGDGYGQFLYKYRATEAGDADSVAKLKEIVLGSLLWLSAPSDFNDPFDMKVNFIAEGGPQKKKDRIRRLVAQQGTRLTRSERRAKKVELLQMPRARLLDGARAAYNIARQEIGVCSFASDARSILMWSHYGNNHRGLCLQFDIARDPASLLFAVRVDYLDEDEYPKINWYVDLQPQLREALLRKHVGWKYEGERRIVLPNGAHSQILFRPEALRSVILGSRASPDLVDCVREIVRERASRNMPKICVLRAREDGSRYALRIFLERA